MRTIISVLIIDPHKDIHDYSNIKTIKRYEYDEENFDIKIVSSSQDIIKQFYNFKGFDSLITIGNDIDFDYLNEMSFEYRKKWTHLEEFDIHKIIDNILNTFLFNLNRIRENGEKLFSIFTCTFNTPKESFMRLYNSLLNQTYKNWNWWILDDSTNDNIIKEYIESIQDSRICVIRNVTNHGNIGFNKHVIASICDGDYLVEVDHDDELTSDCLELLNEAFIKFNTDFVYSDTFEEMNGESIIYGENGIWACGEGWIRDEEINGKNIKISASPYITPYSIRSIHMQPNHVRCWKKEFYHEINGHNYELSVLDDMEILVRTFLYGKMAKINKVLYIQHEGEGERGKNATTAQSVRFGEIQRTDEYLKWRYDREIHNRIISLGYEDTAWNEELNCSELWKEHEINNIMCEIFNYGKD